MGSPEPYKPTLAHASSLQDINTPGQPQTSQTKIPGDGAQILGFITSKARDSEAPDQKLHIQSPVGLFGFVLLRRCWGPEIIIPQLIASQPRAQQPHHLCSLSAIQHESICL